jgi:hypothetical protein
MPGRDPEALTRSQTVGDEIRRLMREKGLTGVGLREALLAAGYDVPNEMWVTRRLTGAVNTVEPVKVVYGPTDDLKAIAKVLDVDPNRLVRVVNRKNPNPAPNPPTTADDESADTAV